MAVVLIDDLNDVEDVFELVTYLARALESGDVERLLEDGTITLTKGPGTSANQVADMVRLDREDEECWACWSDVHRGAIAAADCLIDFGVSR